MDSIEDRYTLMKAITSIALVIALMVSFVSLLIKENLEILRYININKFRN